MNQKKQKKTALFSALHLQSVDVDWRSSRPVGRAIVALVRRLLLLFLLQRPLLRGHLGFFLLDQFGAVQHHLPSQRVKGQRPVRGGVRVGARACACASQPTCTTAYSTSDEKPNSRQAMSQMSMAFTYETLGSSEASNMLSLDSDSTDRMPARRKANAPPA